MTLLAATRGEIRPDWDLVQAGAVATRQAKKTSGIPTAGKQARHGDGSLERVLFSAFYSCLVDRPAVYATPTATRGAGGHGAASDLFFDLRRSCSLITSVDGLVKPTTRPGRAWSRASRSRPAVGGVVSYAWPRQLGRVRPRAPRASCLLSAMGRAAVTRPRGARWRSARTRSVFRRRYLVVRLLHLGSYLVVALATTRAARARRRLSA